MLRKCVKDMERQMESTVEAAMVAVKTLEVVVEAEERGRRGQAPRGVLMNAGARSMHSHTSERFSEGDDEARTMVQETTIFPLVSFAGCLPPFLSSFAAAPTHVSTICTAKQTMRDRPVDPEVHMPTRCAEERCVCRRMRFASWRSANISRWPPRTCIQELLIMTPRRHTRVITTCAAMVHFRRGADQQTSRGC
jgi:hypothetical protein